MQPPPFTRYLGIEFARRDSSGAVATLELGPQHLNMRGVVHGGVLTALLDSALGAAVVASIPPEWWCATTSLSTQFLAGTGEGRVTAAARVVHRGARVAFASGEVRDAKDRLVATAHGTWHLWPHRPGRRETAATADGVVLRGSGELLRVSKIVAVGRNYREHNAEMGGPRDAPPVLFLKPPSALRSSGEPVAIPVDAGAVHHEVELVAVIGRKTQAVAAEAALEHVLGYAVGLDLTLRDLQSEAKKRGEPWSVAKGFDGSAPVSLVAPREAVGDGAGLAIELEVNGARRQSGNTSEMIHGVAALVAFASRYMTLERGDLLFTGTPAGVGPLVPGDRVTARIERVGELELEIEADGEACPA